MKGKRASNRSGKAAAPRQLSPSKGESRTRGLVPRAAGTRATSLRYVYWQDGRFWIGYLEEFPDYMTQGKSHADLKAHLSDLYRDLTSGCIPAVRRVAELKVA